jgi:hypothetical protein
MLQKWRGKEYDERDHPIMHTNFTVLLLFIQEHENTWTCHRNHASVEDIIFSKKRTAQPQTEHSRKYPSTTSPQNLLFLYYVSQ